MRLGISLASSTSLDAASAGRHVVERTRRAVAAGVDSITLGDQHIVGGGGYLQNTPTLGRLLAECPGVRAGCLFLLPMWPPVLVAEQVGTLAALHDAPFIVQTGIGGSPVQFAALGASPARRVTVIEEAVRVVQALLAGDRVSSDVFGFDDVSIGLRPHQPVEWSMGTMNDAGVRRAARFGAAWYAGPSAGAELRQLGETYRAACDEHGTTPVVNLRRDALILADGDRARRLAEAAIARGYRGMSIERLLVGSAAEVAEQVAADAAVGVDEVVVRTMALDPALDLETIDHLAAVRRLLSD